MPDRHPFARQDPSDDSLFYAQPRLVDHIDDGARAALREHYGSILPRGGRILDLMSAWSSHLPGDPGGGPHPYEEVVGLGMNEVELAENFQLDSRVVHDLNQQPALAFEEDTFDAAVCTVSVQYLIRPVEVFFELARVVCSGGPVVVAFSNRCFPTKAVALWQMGGDDHHSEIVRAYFTRAGFEDIVDQRLVSTDDPMFVVSARSPG